jgi:hypothetical protein
MQSLQQKLGRATGGWSAQLGEDRTGTMRSASQLPKSPHRPSAGTHLRRAALEVLVATVIPLALFATYSDRWGTTTGIAAAAIWALGVTVVQIKRNGRLSGLIILSLITLSIKSISGLATGSSFLFFAVPCGGTAIIGLMFAWSGTWDQPLLVRLARDVVPALNGHLSAKASRSFVLRLSWTWGLAYIANAAGTFLLLMLTPLHLFLFLHVFAGWTCDGLAGLTTILLAHRYGPHLLRALRDTKQAQLVPVISPAGAVPELLAA